MITSLTCKLTTPDRVLLTLDLVIRKQRSIVTHLSVTYLPILANNSTQRRLELQIMGTPGIIHSAIKFAKEREDISITETQ